MADRILHETKYLRLIDRDGWTFVDRPHIAGVVTIVAVTNDGKLLLVEQLRRPVGRQTIELPAGLAGDDEANRNEPLIEAARRELLEETGYRAGSLQALPVCATTPGMTDEMVSFFLATDLEAVQPGGGVEGENITVHTVPLAEVAGWLAKRSREGLVVAAKVYAGLFFAYAHAGLRPALPAGG